MTRDAKKRLAGRAAIEFVEPGTYVGVGTGSTANHFIDALGEIRERVRGAVPSSEASARLLRERGVAVVDLATSGRLPLYVDGADESTRTRMLIKGGGGALTREKIVAAFSERFVCVVDDSKIVDRLGSFPLPVEVVALALPVVHEALETLGGRPVLRKDFTTDNGNVIVDVHDLVIDDPVLLETRIDGVAGVVTNGLFARRPADLLLVADDRGVTRV